MEREIVLRDGKWITDLQEGEFVECRCTNEQCKAFDKVVGWDQIRCCNCGQETMTPTHIQTLKLNTFVFSEENIFHGGFLRSSNMTSTQKKQMLKKRSHQHFNKEIKERKHEMDNNRSSGMRE